MREISRRAKAALKLIGEESAINARRVRSLGVTVLQPNGGEQAAEEAAAAAPLPRGEDDR
jgi:hypothetical protein